MSPSEVASMVLGVLMLIVAAVWFVVQASWSFVRWAWHNPAKAMLVATALGFFTCLYLCFGLASQLVQPTPTTADVSISDDDLADPAQHAPREPIPQLRPDTPNEDIEDPWALWLEGSEGYDLFTMFEGRSHVCGTRIFTTVGAEALSVEGGNASADLVFMINGERRTARMPLIMVDDGPEPLWDCDLLTVLGAAEPLIDDASSRCTDEHLAKLDADELRIRRNEVFARHGRTFKNDVLQRYFDGQPWYRPDPKYSDATVQLTEEDKACLERVKKVESGASTR